MELEWFASYWHRNEWIPAYFCLQNSLFFLLFPVSEFLQNHLIDLIDVSASHCNDQITRFGMVADILADICKVFVLSFIIGFWIRFILREPHCPRNFFSKLTGENPVGILFPRAHNIRQNRMRRNGECLCKIVQKHSSTREGERLEDCPYRMEWHFHGSL